MYKDFTSHRGDRDPSPRQLFAALRCSIQLRAPCVAHFGANVDVTDSVVGRHRTLLSFAEKKETTRILENEKPSLGKTGKPATAVFTARGTILCVANQPTEEQINQQRKEQHVDATKLSNEEIQMLRARLHLCCCVFLSVRLFESQPVRLFSAQTVVCLSPVPFSLPCPPPCSLSASPPPSPSACLSLAR